MAQGIGRCWAGSTFGADRGSNRTPNNSLGIVHLSDSPKGQWRHDPIGTGEIDFAAIAALLKQRNYAGRIVLEILSDRPLHDLEAGAALLQKLGLAFTRGA